MKAQILIGVALCFLVMHFPVSGQQIMSWDEAYERADAKLEELTLDEKIAFTHGYSSFFFYGVPEKGIPYLYLSDATQGIHIRDNLADTTMVRQLDRSTAFPCPIALAATFNPTLAYQYAKAVGEECRSGGIEVLLGPGVNIYRNSQCGRNFEYFGEDPYLSSVMTAEYVRGLQSTGTAACLKHFIGNETEFYRRRSNSLIDERALHEIYMPPFKAGIDAGAAYVMTSYNQLNGEWVGQNKEAIQELLRGHLGFRGCVMSDWKSVYDIEKVVKSGQNVEMPGRSVTDREIRDLLDKGIIEEEDIDRMIRPNLATGFAFGLYSREKYSPELLNRMPAHEHVVKDVAAEAIVLLRNNGILPLSSDRKILLTGRFIDQIPRTGGCSSASAEVIGYNNVSLRNALQKEFGSSLTVVTEPSYDQLVEADVVIFSTGTIDVESFERPFELPEEEERLIMRAVDANPNTIVVVNSGSGIRMTEWNEKAAAILYSWYPGQNGFEALADILAGKINPSGKLPMTIERAFDDSPAKGTMPDGAEFYHKAPRAYNERMINIYDVNYAESVLVGYRWYETQRIQPLYPFGYGLSYTKFTLRPKEIPQSFPRKGPLKLVVELTNTGKKSGAEVVQLYVGESNPSVLRPKKELKDFCKIKLEPGESKIVRFELDRSSLAYWDMNTHNWKVNPGEYVVHVGTSSADIALSVPIVVK